MTRVVLLAMLCLAPSLAAAQLDEGQRLLEEADFEGAIAALDRAEQQDGLTREEVVMILEARAIARRANGDDGGSRADLEALASLDPDHAFPPEAPPELEAELRGLAAAPLTVDVEWEEANGDATVHATVTGDVRRLVTTVVIWTRVGGRTPWRRSTGRSATIDAGGGRAEAYVEALGPGGAVIATAGRRDAPLTPRREVEPTDSGPTAPSDRDDTWLHIGLAAGGGALALVIIIAVAVSVSSQPAETRLDGPVIVDF